MLIGHYLSCIFVFNELYKHIKYGVLDAVLELLGEMLRYAW